MEQLKNESSRQYEYMEEMKKWVQKKSGELGRKLTCHVTTFGCQMNEKDSEKLLGILETIGYEEVETEEADLNKLNLAQLLNDGDKIYVPNKSDEIEDYKDTTGKSSTVNLNTATLEELTSLPGIGVSTAQKIIDYRKQNGKFKTVEDLKNVSGIGESKFDNIKDKITVR